MVWNNDVVANPTLPSPEQFGWTLDGDQWVPLRTNLPPASQAIIHLVKCKCAKETCSTNRCQCRKNRLNCKDLCGCSDSGERCENVRDDEDDDSSDGNESDEEECGYDYDSDVLSDKVLQKDAVSPKSQRDLLKVSSQMLAPL